MRQEDIQFFAGIAPKWDSMEVRSLPARINHILDLADIRPGMSVADLGTGTGVLLPYLLERVGGAGTVTAVDGVKEMLAIAREKLGESHINLTMQLLDFEEGELPGRYDRILLYCVYPHLQHPIETLRRLRDNSLTEQGAIIIAFPNDENFVNHIHAEKESDADYLPSAPALALYLFDNGFKVKIIEYTEDSYVVRIARG